VSVRLRPHLGIRESRKVHIMRDECGHDTFAAQCWVVSCEETPLMTIRLINPIDVTEYIAQYRSRAGGPLETLLAIFHHKPKSFPDPPAHSALTYPPLDG
jgi:hypothetical protein